MTDLEGHCGVVRLFLAHALIREIGFVFYAGFPETLAQWNDADFAFVISGIGEGLGFGFMGFAAVAGVEAVKCSGNGGVGQRLAIEEDADFEAFADVNIGRVVQRYDDRPGVSVWFGCVWRRRRNEAAREKPTRFLR